MNGFDFDDEAGIETIIRSREAGFRFTHMCSADEVVAIHGERRHVGAVDVFLVRAVDEAYAAGSAPVTTAGERLCGSFRRVSRRNQRSPRSAAA